MINLVFYISISMVLILLFGLLSWCGVRWKRSQHLAGGAVGGVVSVSQNEATD